MQNEFTRTELLLGPEAMERLGRARVAVFGIGGVGGYAVEALARCGIGALDLIDDDRVSITNINRQLLATHETIGQYKVDAAAARIAAIHPACAVRTYKTFYLPETAHEFDFRAYSYVIDAIDTVSGKIRLVLDARDAGTPIISCMGAGNKLDPTAFRVADISKTSVCPLARVMRRELKKRGVKHLKVVYSTEPAVRPHDDGGGLTVEEDRRGPVRRDIPGSVSFVPPAAGLILAGEVIKDLAGVGGTLHE